MTWDKNIRGKKTHLLSWNLTRYLVSQCPGRHSKVMWETGQLSFGQDCPMHCRSSASLALPLNADNGPIYNDNQNNSFSFSKLPWRAGSTTPLENHRYMWKQFEKLKALSKHTVWLIYKNCSEFSGVYLHYIKGDYWIIKDECFLFL